MQLYILDKNPNISASMIPDRYKFKMLIELGQLICSSGISNIYKTIPQGKELQAWVFSYRPYVYQYFETLLDWSRNNIRCKEETLEKLEAIKNDLFKSLYELPYVEPNFAFFRYSERYTSDVKSGTLLSLDECINHYKQYLIWKEDKSRVGSLSC